MKIVIDIHEKDYQSIKNGHIPFSVLNAIKKGIPLPEHHGRLIDADALMENCLYFETIIDLEKAPTIIEGAIQNDE